MAVGLVLTANLCPCSFPLFYLLAPSWYLFLSLPHSRMAPTIHLPRRPPSFCVTNLCPCASFQCLCGCSSRRGTNGNGVLNGGVSFLFRIRHHHRLFSFYPEPVLGLLSNPKILCPQAAGEGGELRQGLSQLALSSFIVDVPPFLFSQAACDVTLGPAYTSIHRIALYIKVPRC